MPGHRISLQPSKEDIHHLKGHGNKADFLGFLQKSVRHRFLTLHFEPFDLGFVFSEIFVIKEVIKEQPPPANLSATARRVLWCTRSPKPTCSFNERFFGNFHCTVPVFGT
jgi:hypothetical protein